MSMIDPDNRKFYGFFRGFSTCRFNNYFPDSGMIKITIKSPAGRNAPAASPAAEAAECFIKLRLLSGILLIWDCKVKLKLKI